MRVLKTKLSKSQCIERFKDRLDSRLMIGQERFVGWSVFNLFSVNYYSGKEFGRRNYPIHNKAVGIITTQNGNTLVKYWVFKGTTDPVSLFYIYFLSTLILLIVRSNLGIDVKECFLIGLMWTALVSIITFLFTVLSDTGQENEKELLGFISSVFEGV